jgi:hypothetical protein
MSDGEGGSGNRGTGRRKLTLVSETQRLRDASRSNRLAAGPLELVDALRRSLLEVAADASVLRPADVAAFATLLGPRQGESEASVTLEAKERLAAVMSSALALVTFLGGYPDEQGELKFRPLAGPAGRQRRSQRL